MKMLFDIAISDSMTTPIRDMMFKIVPEQGLFWS
jgi:hypothetical protein